eukprot:900554_1
MAVATMVMATMAVVTMAMTMTVTIEATALDIGSRNSIKTLPLKFQAHPVICIIIIFVSHVQTFQTTELCSALSIVSVGKNALFETSLKIMLAVLFF